jgi:membrane-bound serine protease (ClpP class)
VPVIVVTGFRVLPNTAVGRRMILTRRELDDTRAADAGAIDPRPDPDPLIEGESVEIGMIGQAGTDLRPTGTGRFGRQRVSVVTEGEWIDHDTAIRVVRVEGNRIVVEAAT